MARDLDNLFPEGGVFASTKGIADGLAAMAARRAARRGEGRAAPVTAHDEDASDAWDADAWAAPPPPPPPSVVGHLRSRHPERPVPPGLAFHAPPLNGSPTPLSPPVAAPEGWTFRQPGSREVATPPAAAPATASTSRPPRPGRADRASGRGQASRTKGWTVRETADILQHTADLQDSVRREAVRRALVAAGQAVSALPPSMQRRCAASNRRHRTGGTD